MHTNKKREGAVSILSCCSDWISIILGEDIDNAIIRCSISDDLGKSGILQGCQLYGIQLGWYIVYQKHRNAGID